MMGNKQKDKVKKPEQTPAPVVPTLDLTDYEFIYKSEPTFVVPLIDFISGLAPLQPPLAKKETMEHHKNKSRFMREFLSHELVEAFSFNPAQLSKRILELGGLLGFRDNISRSVLHDAGIKLNRFYWLVYLTYILTFVFILAGLAYWFFILPSVPAYLSPTPSPSPSASPTVLASVPPTVSSGLPTSVPSVAPSSVPPTAPPGLPTSVASAIPSSIPPTASPTPAIVAPIGGVDKTKLMNYSLLFAPISVVLGFIFIFIVIRLGILVAGKRYASTLCLLACLYIVIELEQDDILSIDRIKNRLLNRIDFLARYIPMVGLNMSLGDPSVKDWTLQYFRTMQKYVRQLERWVIAPKRDTLQVLREDFYTMAGILLHGNYNDIDWVTVTANIQDKPQTPGQRIGSAFQGFMSIGIPILLLLGVAFFHQQIQDLNMDNRVISLVAFAWFLIAVDLNLRLGVIDRILAVAKTIKELK